MTYIIGFKLDGFSAILADICVTKDNNQSQNTGIKTSIFFNENGEISDSLKKWIKNWIIGRSSNSQKVADKNITIQRYLT